jgi:hypothetical protein
MKNDNDFEEFGKKIPYSVPDDFFKNITIKTLGKAKEEIRKSRISKIIISVSVAATVLIVFSIGFSVLKSNQQKQEIVITQNQLPEKPEIEIQRDEMIQYETEEKATENINIEAHTEETDQPETIEDLFAQMNEDELRELASILSDELFFDDLTIELR